MSDYSCPKCLSQLKEEAACGSVSYFCSECRVLISRSKILSPDDLAKTGAEQ